MRYFLLMACILSVAIVVDAKQIIIYRSEQQVPVSGETVNQSMPTDVGIFCSDGQPAMQGTMGSYCP